MTAELQSGQRLGPYQIVEELGRGGMAVVYKAWQFSLERHVALKVLPEYYRHDPQFLARFRREAQEAAKLSHPNIMQIFETGQVEGLHYIAMEYLEGGSLHERVAAGALGLDDAERILAQVASALDYAHSQGLVHRDIKPANILFAADGTAKVTDFGIVRAADGTRLTQTGALLGTPEYMSPEQATGLVVDHRTDCYALGVVLYQMLTGQVPYRGTTPYATLHAIIYQAPPPPRQANPRLSKALEGVLLKALAKDPEERFQSCTALVGALRAARRGVKVAVPKTTKRRSKAAPSDRSWPGSWVLALGGVGAVVAVVAIWLLLSAGSSGSGTATVTVQALVTPTAPQATASQVATVDVQATEDAVQGQRTTATAQVTVDGPATGTPDLPKSENETATADAAQRDAAATAMAATATAGAAQQDAENQATRAAMEATQDAVAVTQTALAYPTATPSEPPPTPTPLPPTPTKRAPTLTPRPPTPTPLPPPTATQPPPPTATPAPKGSRIAFVSDREGGLRQIYFMNADGTGVTRRTYSGGEERFLAWSPNGQRVAFTSERDGNWEVYIMNADGSNPRNLTNHPGIDRRPWFSPSGDRIVFVSDRDGDHDIWMMNADGSGKWNMGRSPGLDRAPCWSADGRRIVFSSERSGGDLEIYVMNADGGGVTRLTHSPGKDAVPVWSPDGRRIAFRSARDDNSEIYVMNADGSGQTNLTQHSANDWDPSWSPDGRRIAFSSNRSGQLEVYTMNADGGGVTPLTNHGAYDGQPSWSPGS